MSDYQTREAEKRVNEIEAKQKLDEEIETLISAVDIEDLEAEDLSNINWIWRGYIAPGLKTQFNGHPKSGKTITLVELLQHLYTGKDFMDIPVRKTKSLVISEEPKIIWGNRRDLNDLRGFMISCQPFIAKPKLKDWEVYCDKIAEFAIKNEIELVIFDTINDFWPINNENDSAEVLNALTPINSFTKRNLAVLLIQHTSRLGYREGGSARGSNASSGKMDIIIDLLKENPNPQEEDNIRVIIGDGRFKGTITPRKIRVEYNFDKGFKRLDFDKKDETEERILRLLYYIFTDKLPEALKFEGATAENIQSYWPLSEQELTTKTIRKYLLILEEKKMVTVQRFKGNKPWLFFANRVFTGSSKKSPMPSNDFPQTYAQTLRPIENPDSREKSDNNVVFTQDSPSLFMPEPLPTGTASEANLREANLEDYREVPGEKNDAISDYNDPKHWWNNPKKEDL